MRAALRVPGCPRAVPAWSVWVWVSVCECARWHTRAGCNAAASERRGLEPRLSRTKSLAAGSRNARAPGEGAGPSLGPEPLWVLWLGGFSAGPFPRQGPQPGSPPLELRVLLARGAQAGPARGARTPCRRRRRASAAGTKTPPPAPAPAPARSSGQARGWAPCGEAAGHGAVRGLGVPGRCLRNAGTGRSPLARTWQLSPEIGSSVGGQCPLGGARPLGPPGGVSRAGVQPLGQGRYKNLGDWSLPQGTSV